MKREAMAVLSETQSVCPVCLSVVDATIEARGDLVFMRKTCPAHGEFQALVWRGDPPYESWSRPRIPFTAKHALTEVSRGCPFDCGLCPDHRQQTCTALIEVTSGCNLSCAFCFADSGRQKRSDPDMTEIRERYETLLQTDHSCNVQISGGEPTIHDDLPEIVALGRSMGFGFIQLNTNGLRIASDAAYLERLKNAGLSSVFLQFDGTENGIHRALRGGDFLDLKIRAVRYCGEMELGVVLVPTVVSGVNVHNVGEVISFALENMPTVRGVHFQPATFAGRYPGPPVDDDRVTLPDVMRAIESQTDGRIRMENFAPPGCENSRCSFHGTFVLMPGGEIKGLTMRHGQESPRGCESAEHGAAQARECVAEQWSSISGRTAGPAQDDYSMGFWDLLLERSLTHRLSISAMAFQDAWNLDLERLKECCIHMVAADGRLVPFCAYNLTGSDGRPLYGRGRP